MSTAMTERYLSLLKKSLLNELYLENEARILGLLMQLLFPRQTTLDEMAREFLNARHGELYARVQEMRRGGGWIQIRTNTADGTSSELVAARNFAFVAHSMIGRARMDNLHDCMNAVLADRIPGDFIETGVWKGGSTIFMRGFLQAHDIHDRKVWVADSFEGLPKPSLPEDENWDLSADVMPYLAVSEEEVRELFERYELLDEQVMFLKGWFKDTLPTADIDKLAVLRLDGDLYESTMDALNALYHKLSPGGFVIVDDYNALPQCEQAITDFRRHHGIQDELVRIDEMSVFWRKR